MTSSSDSEQCKEKKKWTRGKKIAEGGYMKVYLATFDKTGKRFAVKSCDKDDLEQRLVFENEKRLLKMCKSPYINKYLGSDISLQEKKFYNKDCVNLWVQLVPRGDVADYMMRRGGVLEEKVAATFVRDILRALVYLHDEVGIVHGDVKPANVLRGDKHLILCDLGGGKLISAGDTILPPRPGDDPQQQRVFVTGTPGYRAPEVDAEVAQGPPSDIYSLGCSVVDMLTGLPPSRYIDEEDGDGFGDYEDDDDDGDSDDGEKPDEPKPPMYLSVLDEEVKSFVMSCMKEIPGDRPTAEDLLSHPWMVKWKHVRYRADPAGSSHSPTAVSRGPGFADRTVAPPSHQPSPQPDVQPTTAKRDRKSPEVVSESRGWRCSPSSEPNPKRSAH